MSITHEELMQLPVVERQRVLRALRNPERLVHCDDFVELFQVIIYNKKEGVTSFRDSFLAYFSISSWEFCLKILEIMRETTTYSMR